MKRINIIIYAWLLFFTSACNFNAATKKLQKSAAGFEYEIIKSDSNINLKFGDVVKLHLTQYADDSLMNTTYTSLPEYIKIDSATINKFDYTAILPLLHINDSAVCYFSTTQIIKNAANDKEIPEFLKTTKQIKVCIKVLKSYQNDSIASKEYFGDKAVYMSALQKKDSVNLVQANLQFDSLINKETGPVTKLLSGIYVKVIKTGTGNRGVSGDSISILYKSYLPDGNLVEASNAQNPLVLKKSGEYAIKGFYEATANLTKGSMAKLFIPAMAAYGKSGYGRKVPPFSNLIIEVEIL
jgi:FKBP-type peptidyl-prolyl cis-trans isomerase